MDFKIAPEILAELPTGFYTVIGALIVGNITFISGAVGMLFRHFLDFNTMKSDIARLQEAQKETKKDLDSLWDRIRSSFKPQ